MVPADLDLPVLRVPGHEHKESSRPMFCGNKRIKQPHPIPILSGLVPMVMPQLLQKWLLVLEVAVVGAVDPELEWAGVRGQHSLGAFLAVARG